MLAEPAHEATAEVAHPEGSEARSGGTHEPITKARTRRGTFEGFDCGGSVELLGASNASWAYRWAKRGAVERCGTWVWELRLNGAKREDTGMRVEVGLWQECRGLVSGWIAGQANCCYARS